MKLAKSGAIALITLSLSVSSLTVSAPVQASEQLATSLCGYVAADDKRGLRKKLKASGVKMRKVYGAVVCNGMSMLRFAMTSGSHKAGSFIAKKLSSSILSETENDGYTILGWAEKNGMGATKTASAIKSRI